jgi:hypothetical protein
MRLMAGHLRDSAALITQLFATEDFGARDNARGRSGIPIARK